MTLPFHTVASVGTGQLHIGPRPDADALETWCEEIARRGIDHVVSLILPQEVERFGLQIEPAQLAGHGVGFSHLPIRDYDTPHAETFAPLVRDIVALMAAGRSVHAHCAGGVGRSGLFASCVLIADGMAADEAMALVSRRRGVQVPETAQQTAFIRAFAP